MAATKTVFKLLCSFIPAAEAAELWIEDGGVGEAGEDGVPPTH